MQISINEKLEIIDSSCDCSEKGFCNHLLAFAIHISEIKNYKPNKKTKAKKISEAELAIENLNSEEIKGWLLEFFKKNKDAEIQFLLEFGEKKIDFSDNEIKTIIDKSIQSVVGKKKNITEIGQWKEVEDHTPYGVEKDQYNSVDFRPVTTTGLRIVAKLRQGESGGVIEWKVNE